MNSKARNKQLQNAEVTTEGIKVRGDPVKGKHQLVTVNSSPVGTIKKRVIYGCFTALAFANTVGLVLNWEPGMENVAWPLGFTYLLGMFTTYITKME